MLNKIKDFFEQQFAEKPKDNKTIDEKINLAAAALLIEISYSDNAITDTEKTVLKKLLHEKFAIEKTMITELVTLAETEVKQSLSSYEFTRIINAYFEKEQKYLLIHAMWEIAYADGNIDRYEEAMIRKLADLLYVSHSDFIRAKISVQESL